MKIQMQCDKCKEIFPGGKTFFNEGYGMDLCVPCCRKLEIDYWKQQCEEKRKRIEEVYLKEIRELDKKIAKLEQMEMPDGQDKKRKWGMVYT